MKSCNLILHCGADAVERDALKAVRTPVATATWQPVPHLRLVEQVERALAASHLTVVNQSHALSHGGDRYFGLMAGVGMDAAVVASMNPTMKKALKEAAFAVQGLGTYLTHEDPLFRVTSEERTVEGYFAVFGNSSNYGGAFGITPLADMRDGLLDVCILKDKSLVSTVWYWTAALINAHIKHPKVEYFRTEEAEIVTVEDGKEVLVQTDGEVAGKLPLTCRVVPRSLRVVVP